MPSSGTLPNVQVVLPVWQFATTLLFEKSNIEAMKNQHQQTKTLTAFVINNVLLLTGIVMIVSGLTLQLGFHVGGGGHHRGNGHGIAQQQQSYEQAREIDELKNVCGFTYHAWSTIHKVAIVLFSLFMIYHFYTHWRWYKTVIAKQLIRKNLQVIILTVLFIVVAFTGLIPWYIDLSGTKSELRFVLIEIHDKLTLVLIIFLVLHFVKRSKWYRLVYKKV
jgi:hypothetical protein